MMSVQNLDYEFYLDAVKDHRDPTTLSPGPIKNRASLPVGSPRWKSSSETVADGWWPILRWTSFAFFWVPLTGQKLIPALSK